MMLPEAEVELTILILRVRLNTAQKQFSLDRRDFSAGLTDEQLDSLSTTARITIAMARDAIDGLGERQPSLTEARAAVVTVIRTCDTLLTMCDSLRLRTTTTFLMAQSAFSGGVSIVGRA